MKTGKKYISFISALIITASMSTTAFAEYNAESNVALHTYCISNFGDYYYYRGGTSALLFSEAFDMTKLSGWSYAKTAIGSGIPASGAGLTLATSMLKGSGSNLRGKPIYNWTYFKKTFELGESFNAETVKNICGMHRIDDAIVIFINGAEVYRYNIFFTDTGINTRALTNWSVYADHNIEAMDRKFMINTDYSSKSAGLGLDSPIFEAGSLTNLIGALKPGTNVLTCVVVRSAADSSNLWFDLIMNIDCDALE